VVAAVVAAGARRRWWRTRRRRWSPLGDGHEPHARNRQGGNDHDSTRTLNLALRRVALLASLLVPADGAAAVTGRRAADFRNAAAALEAFTTALKANDDAALIAVFGEKHKSLVVSGDAAYDSARRAEIPCPLNTFHVLEETGPDRVQLLVGTQAWPYPIPLVRARAAAGVSRPSGEPRRS
jgi:hypothetical protein